MIHTCSDMIHICIYCIIVSYWTSHFLAFCIYGKWQQVFLWILIARNIARDLDEQGILYSFEDAPVHSGAPSRRSSSRKSKDHAALLPSASVKLKHQLSDAQRRFIEEAFELFDTDGEDSLDENELAAALFVLGLDSGGKGGLAKARKLIHDYDDDGSRTISLEEFTAIIGSMMAGKDAADILRAIFRHLADPAQGGGAGAITFEVLCRLGKEHHLRLSDEELQALVDGADTDGGGQVSEEEFVRIMKNTSWM